MAAAETSIREANVADTSAIVHLLRESIARLCQADHQNREGPLRLWLANKTADRISKWIEDPGNVMLIAEIAGDPAGVACFHKDGKVTLNYVAPHHRFKGVSKAMLGSIESRARALSLTRLTLESTATARRLYASAGFKSAGPTQTKHGLNAYPLSKLL